MPFRSASQFGYVRCGTRYELERVEKAPQRQAAWTFQGTSVHAGCLKDDNGEGWEASGRTMPVADAQEIFKRVWAEELAKSKEKDPDLSRWFRGGRKKTEKDIDDRFALGLRQVEQYIEYASQENLKPVRDDSGEYMVEVGFEWNLGPNPLMEDAENADEDLIIVGVIDLIGIDSSGTLLIRDLKTGNEPFRSIQLPTYGYAAEDCMGLVVDWGDYFLCKQEKPSTAQELTSIPKDAVIRYYQKLDEAIRRKVFLPNASEDNCRFCSVQDSCTFFLS